MRPSIHSLLLVALLTAATARAQDEKEKLPKWRIDPYTKNAPRLMAVSQCSW